jgi:hypothetical protein
MMWRSDVAFILRSCGFSIREVDGSTELYEMPGNNLFAHVVSDYGSHSKVSSTVTIFHKDLPLISVLTGNVLDLMDELNSHPKFRTIR